MGDTEMNLVVAIISLTLFYSVLVLVVEMHYTYKDFKAEYTPHITLRHLEEHLALALALIVIHIGKIFHFIHSPEYSAEHFAISLLTSIATLFVAKHFKDERTGVLK